jgi:hypothetical protein
MAFDIFVECVRNGERCMYFVCDFNGRWLKDLNILDYHYNLLASVEGRLVGDCTSKSTPLKCYCCFFSKT